MIKGAQRHLIVVKTGTSRFYEEVHFVMKRDVRPHPYSQSEMLAEAAKILEESESREKCRKKRRTSSLLFFFAGCLLGALISFLIFRFL